MIKSYRQFNESKFSVTFEESDEWMDVKGKNAISDSELKDYFTDLTDDRGFIIDDKIITQMYATDSGIKLCYKIAISKLVNNPVNNLHRATLETYLKFLNEQAEDIKVLNDCLSRIQKSEDLESTSTDITDIPFWGAANNMDENSEFRIGINLKQIIKTKDLEIAKNKFFSKQNPAVESLEKIIKILENAGVKEARRLVTTNTLDNAILYGFITDDEIIVVGKFDFMSEKLQIDDAEMQIAIKSYKDGYCQDSIETD